ncbi:TatD DNase family protein [Brevibacillus sp. AG162]|uniref:TatD family hydrolase n=1 Tax=Brevibacillus sp. AG162 TaxID=2572910 RepID=UPI00116AF12E|nr:TatD family hydrolase [Brevibacillus sp. AG162]TQK74928.1 TatD DNase family protein [Brevibacillus sp. AG162]
MKGSGPSMRFIDFHVHIDHYPDPIRVANEYETHKIYALFVTNLPELFEKHYAKFAAYKFVKLAIGYHPDLTGEFPFNRDLFDKLVQTTSYIGEVGIDISSDTKELINKQVENFEFITQPKYNFGKIYSIHSTGGEDEVLEILKKNKVKQAVFHWYSGKLSTLEKIIECNYLFSINHSMLSSKKGQKIISLIPKDLMLFETDGPFARYNKQLVTPKNIQEIYQKFNECISNFDQHVFRNFKRMLIERDLYKINSKN